LYISLGAVCVSNNHAAQCQCPSGKYTGDPNDPNQGCVSVSCVYNEDCPPHQLCNRLDHTCLDVCDEDSCGENAVCIPENHQPQCFCSNGFKPDPHPDIACSPTVGGNNCDSQPCHPSAICENTADGFICKCEPGQVGDPVNAGCKTKGSCFSDENCPPSSICTNGRCVNPCENKCGINAECRVFGRNSTCSCLDGFEGSAEKGCVRGSATCTVDSECAGSLCISNQCKVICRSTTDCADGERCVSNMCMVPCIGHSQCSSGQACAGGFCVAGCRNNGDCPREQACINHQCFDPCQEEGVCGVNALCRTISHSAQCYCPENFEGYPSPIEGCVRKPTYCATSGDCTPGNVCVGGQCMVSCDIAAQCARGERCQKHLCVKVCYTDSNCQAGEVCVEGGCQPGCRSDSDCKATEVCISNKCRCGAGFESGPTGCRDLNECDDKTRCHPSALCTNTPGSFKCTCADGMFGDPYQGGCTPPSQCQKDSDCPGNLACVATALGAKKCTDPCSDHSLRCGQRAKCTVVGHAAQCVCPSFHLGDPYDKRVGCYPVECLANEDCVADKVCDVGSNKCVNPCNSAQCGRGDCKVENHQAICQCAQGFIVKDNSCVDVNECQGTGRAKESPCHRSGICKNTLGGFTCSCPEGMVGEPFRGQSGCRKAEECFSDAQCPDSAVCSQGKCRDACEGSCGVNAGTNLV